MKQILALLVALVLVLSFPVAFAQDVTAETTDAPAETVVQDTAVSEPTADAAVAEAEATEPVAELTSEPVAEATAEEAAVVEETQEVVEQASEDAGITPDSILYPVETAVDDIALAITTDEAAKAELAIEIADERLAETVVMAEENNTEDAAVAQENYDEAIATAETAVEEIGSLEPAGKVGGVLDLAGDCHLGH